MSSINNFQIMLDSQVGRLPNRSWPATTGITNIPSTKFSMQFSMSDILTENGAGQPKKQRPISRSVLRLQGPAWAIGGAGMCATLHGVYRIFRQFRGLRYFWRTRNSRSCISNDSRASMSRVLCDQPSFINQDNRLVLPSGIRNDSKETQTAPRVFCSNLQILWPFGG